MEAKQTSNVNIKVNITNITYKSFAILFAIAIPTSSFLITLTSIIWGIALIYFLCQQKQQVMPRWQQAWFYWLCAYLVLQLVSIIYTPANSQQIILSLAKNWRLLLIAFWARFFDNEQICYSVVKTFLCVAIISMPVVMINYYNILPNAKFLSRTTTGGFQDSISTGFYMAFAIYLCLLSLRHKLYNKYLVSIALVLLTTFLYGFSFGGTGQVISLALMLLFAWQDKRRKLYAGLVGLVLVIVTVLPVSFNKKMTTAYQEICSYYADMRQAQANKEAVEIVYPMAERMAYIYNTVNLIKQQPWLGFGVASFQVVYNNAQQNKDSKVITKPVQHPHNQYLMILFEQGLIGLLLFAVMLGSLAKLVYANLTSKDSSDFFTQVATGLWLSLLLGCLANSWLQDFCLSHFFVLFFAMLVAKASKSL